jgi:hypothetical protein
MQVLRQYTYCNSLEWQAALNRTIRLPKEINLLDQKIARSVGKGYRKEKRATLDLRASISRHGRDGAVLPRGHGATRLCPPYNV